MSEARSGRPSIRTLLLVGVAFLFTIFMFQNTEVVEINFLFWRLPISRFLILLGSLAIGFFIGLLAGWEWFRKKQKP